MENINDSIRRDISEGINEPNIDYLYPEDDSEGSRLTIYAGKVVDNKDPGKLGRCRIRVFSLFSEDINDNDLPWALPDFGFIGSLKGSFIVPPVGAIVSVYFELGDRYLPRYVNKIIDETNMPSDKNTDYPDNMIFYETDNGDKFIINRRRKTTEFTHSSGTKIKIDALGNVEIDSSSSIKTKHKLFLEDDGGFVIPGTQGPYCAIPICPITGAQHIGQKCSFGV
ncbi:MAG: phage baseplate assembly protein V [bacterium]